MQKVKVGLIGSGFIAEHHCNAYTQIPDVEVIAIASALEEEAKKMSTKYRIKKGQFKDYKDLLKLDLDAVSLCVPNFLHKDIAIAALEAGKHVIIEKPLARTPVEGQAILDAATRAGKTVFYCENNIYAPAFNKVKEIIDQGALGHIYIGRGKEQHSGPHSQWFYKKESSGGGSLLDLGIHDVACLLWFLGDDVENVFCQIKTTQPDRGKFGQCEVEDNAVGILYFKKGAMVTIEESWTAPGGYDMRFELYGTTGQLTVDPCRNDQLVCYTSKGFGYAVEKADTTTGWTFPVPGEDYFFGYVQEMQHFVSCIIENKVPRTGGDLAMKALKIVDAMYKSATTGRIEKV
jgi:myo-inositol 2-dehydrogenase/D-chiro-inositol 1-dehydrogenase